MADKKAQMALCQTSVMKIYTSVIEDVILSVRDSFLDEGVDEQVLQEMKNLWRNKLSQSKAVDANPEPPELQPPPIVANNPKPSKAAQAKAKKAAAAAAAAQHQTQHSATSSMTHHSNNHNNNLNNNSNNNYNNNNNIGLKNGFNKVNGLPGSTLHQSSSSLSSSQPPPLSSTNPPPLTPTAQATLLAQQRSSMTSNNSNTATAGGGPYVQSLDPNRVMPVNITLPAQAGVANAETRVLTIHVPASALQESHLTQILSAHLISSIMSLPPTLASSVLQQHVNAALMQKNLTISKQMDGDTELPIQLEDSCTGIAISLKNIEINNDAVAAAAAASSRRKLIAKNDAKLNRGLLSIAVQLDGGNITSDEEVSEDSDENLDNDDDDDLDKDDDIDEENVGAEEEPLNSEDDVTDEESTDLFETDNVIVCQYDKITRSRNKWKFYLKDGIINICGKDYVFQRAHGDAEW